MMGARILTIEIDAETEAFLVRSADTATHSH